MHSDAACRTVHPEEGVQASTCRTTTFECFIPHGIHHTDLIFTVCLCIHACTCKCRWVGACPCYLSRPSSRCVAGPCDGDPGRNRLGPVCRGSAGLRCTRHGAQPCSCGRGLCQQRTTAKRGGLGHVSGPQQLWELVGQRERAVWGSYFDTEGLCHSVWCWAICIAWTQRRCAVVWLSGSDATHCIQHLASAAVKCSSTKYPPSPPSPRPALA
jgi:hypothetical protein